MKRLQKVHVVKTGADNVGNWYNDFSRNYVLEAI